MSLHWLEIEKENSNISEMKSYIGFKRKQMVIRKRFSPWLNAYSYTFFYCFN